MGFNKSMGKAQPENDVHFHVNVGSEVSGLKQFTHKQRGREFGSDYSRDSDDKFSWCSAHAACYLHTYERYFCALEKGKNHGKCMRARSAPCKTDSDCLKHSVLPVSCGYGWCTKTSCKKPGKECPIGWKCKSDGRCVKMPKEGCEYNCDCDQPKAEKFKQSFIPVG